LHPISSSKFEMRFSHLAFLGSVLSLLPTQSLALKCGIKGITEPCIGATDVRYDRDVSFDLKEQNEIWKLIEGLYMGEGCVYNADGTPQNEAYAIIPKEIGLGTYNLCNSKIFFRFTVIGSRISLNHYSISKHNADGTAFGGQLPGIVYPTDGYYTSTFEKDGGVSMLGAVLAWNQNFTVAEEATSMNPVAGKALFGVTDDNEIGKNNYHSMYCVDSDCNHVNTYAEQYIVDPETGSATVNLFTRESLKKVNKETWMAGMNQAFIDYNVPTPESPFDLSPDFNVSFFTQPFDPTTTATIPECFTLACPTEDDWKSADPVFGKTPYIEPNGVLTGGFIAGITIASIVIAVAIFSYIYKRGVEAREKRVKEAVLKSIAKSMTVTMSKNLSPRELENMFKKIDTDGNGSISKAEVKGLVDEAGVANMSERDYNVLFGSIDLDENGTLDFAEFCAFFASISSSDNFDDDA